MQDVINFMRDFFCARIVEEQRYQASRLPFRQKFFSSDCWWDSRGGTLEMMESERIVSTDGSDLEAMVITAYNIPFFASGAKTHRRRYHLKATGGNWLIWLVENECPACNGQGDESCIYCKGKHWTGGQRGINH
jgi:hypothetical protein